MKIRISLVHPQLSLTRLLLHEPQEFPETCSDRQVIVYSKSVTNVIVGFGILVSHSRSKPIVSVIINDRVYPLSNRVAVIALKPNEVHLGAIHELPYRGDGPICVNFISPFVVPAAILEIPREEVKSELTAYESFSLQSRDFLQK
jgi:hypothetical protein